ncbi:hypothetical protein EYF80_067536 [Liparis tanakae]|uniref:Uncharacterized protein n=1 Tax=Liparis tanakae TaxID=230148 RepID=A0A4Z2E1I8_9TELE|nr:hypothetical protein EYF80_067536 [Liparis tanakae]
MRRGDVEGKGQRTQVEETRKATLWRVRTRGVEATDLRPAVRPDTLTLTGCGRLTKEPSDRPAEPLIIRATPPQGAPQARRTAP